MQAQNDHAVGLSKLIRNSAYVSAKSIKRIFDQQKYIKINILLMLKLATLTVVSVMLASEALAVSDSSSFIQKNLGQRKVQAEIGVDTQKFERIYSKFIPPRPMNAQTSSLMVAGDKPPKYKYTYEAKEIIPFPASQIVEGIRYNFNNVQGGCQWYNHFPLSIF